MYDPLGTWSDDDDIVVREEDDDVDVSEEKVKELLNQKFPGKFRIWRNKLTAVDWRSVEDKVSERNSSALDMLELMGMDISTMNKGLEEGGI